MVLVALMAGCRQKPAACWVKGQVRFEGQNVVDGSLRMDPVGPSASPGGASRIVNGSYDIPRPKGMLAGKYRIKAMAVRPTGRKLRNPERLSDSDPMEIDEQLQYLPDCYNERSEVVIELVPGENVQDFDWKSK